MQQKNGGGPHRRSDIAINAGVLHEHRIFFVTNSH